MNFNKISTCTFKPMDLEMEKTVVQLLSRAKAIEIKGFAVEGTIKKLFIGVHNTPITSEQVVKIIITRMPNERKY